MKIAIRIVVTAALLLGTVLGTRTVGFSSRQVHVEPIEGVAVDREAAARRLAGAIRFPTVSFQEETRFDAEAFLGLHRYLEESFPRAHAALRREVVAGYSLLYTWAGEDSGLAPILLLSHLDVVPVEPGSEDDWSVPAFEGRIADGRVWGRGALDDKAGVLGILEAVEALLAEGFRPERTVLLAFGHDEEVGGSRGAGAIGALLAERRIAPQYVLDEGGLIADGVVPAAPAPVALVGIAEKGYLSVELTVETLGGHSSMPPPETAIGVLGAAIRRLEERQMPAHVRGATASSFEYLGPEMPLVNRIALANLWLFEPLVTRAVAATPAGNASVRTTTAATIVEAGVKENVLPRTARAVVNFRILPGDTTEDVMEHVRRTVADPRVTIARFGMNAREPSPVSDVEGPVFGALQRAISQTFPDVIVAPNLLVGGTDTVHYAKLTRDVYRFLPMKLRPEDLARFHGVDERIDVANYGDVVRFFARLVRATAGPPASG